KDRNLQMLKERNWFDIPVVYNSNRRAIIAMEKVIPGDNVFAEAQGMESASGEALNGSSDDAAFACANSRRSMAARYGGGLPLDRVGGFKCFQMADYLSAMAPVSTNALSLLGESGYALAGYRAFLEHARKPSSHDQQSPRHGVWPTCGPNCAAYIAHNFPGTLGLFCRTLRLRSRMNSAKAWSLPQETDTGVYGSFSCLRRTLDP